VNEGEGNGTREAKSPRRIRNPEGPGEMIFYIPVVKNGEWVDAMPKPVSVRYIVNSVDEAIGFYTTMLDFKVEMHPAAEFAILARGNLRLLLSRPSERGGGGQAMPDGTIQTPGGWNRFEIEVEDLPSVVDRLRKAGCRFRNDMVTGIGGRQILLQDPSGNLIELFQYFEEWIR
jgi:catechol 2,3-dioxygenase-like lactoylglutathione lyase family enzyme